MNSKLLLLVTALFVASLLGNLYFVAGNSSKLSLSKSSSSNDVPQLPLSIDHKGVTSQILVYNFSGKITKVTPVGSDIRLTLDVSDATSPDFRVTKNTKVFKITPGALPIETTINDLKPDVSVAFGMLYDLKNKKWDLGAISIIDTTKGSSLPLTPPPASSPSSQTAPIKAE